MSALLGKALGWLPRAWFELLQKMALTLNSERFAADKIVIEGTLGGKVAYG
jgi:hypothetical protein